MNKILKIVLVLSFALLGNSLYADEGMWIPMLLQKNEADMQKAGMHISAKDIYDINHACLKDAIILFNQGCTGEYVSDEGLFLTNHHCGYSYITANSTVEHDYLTHGFWAMDRAQEIPCKGLTATRLVYMKDVTEEVLEGVLSSTPESERQKIIAQNIQKVGNAATEGTHYKYVIKPFYYGNQYFLYVNEVFTDVRLVGAPPSNIGKFGGDTDNWMWPRHTGDFSMFRVYVGPDGRPAPYSDKNVPYHPLKHLDISLKGVEEGDFTFVFGYPGTTNRYATHDEVALKAEQENPVCIALRDIRLRHYKNAMEQSPAQRLRYASKVASIANGWKKWQGESQGLARLDAVNQKIAFEQKFQQWANDKPEYRNVLTDLSQLYQNIAPMRMNIVYYSEALMASEFMSRTNQMFLLYGCLDDQEQGAKYVNAILSSNKSYFKDFENHSKVDKAIFVETFLYMWRAGKAPFMDKKYHSEAEIARALEKIYDRSILNNPAKCDAFFSSYKAGNHEKLRKDPALDLFMISRIYLLNGTELAAYNQNTIRIQQLMRTYVKGMMEMNPEVNYFPDANLTLRVAYGHVQGFQPSDGVYYKPYSTLEGIMEKENPDIYDYVVEPRLKELYRTHDYGRYANSRGELPVGFIATNHTTGGNSGSPVLNADGQLIGLNFDRCWEGTMSDLFFDPNYCRNICLDIRYCLFIIDKFANARHLIDEMTIVQ